MFENIYWSNNIGDGIHQTVTDSLRKYTMYIIQSRLNFYRQSVISYYGCRMHVNYLPQIKGHRTKLLIES